VLFRRSLDLMTVLCGDLPADKVVAIESRGSSSAAPSPTGSGPASSRPQAGQAALEVRKATYQLEYGTDTLEMHEDAVGRPTACSWWTT